MELRGMSMLSVMHSVWPCDALSTANKPASYCIDKGACALTQGGGGRGPTWGQYHRSPSLLATSGLEPGLPELLGGEVTFPSEL